MELAKPGLVRPKKRDRPEAVSPKFPVMILGDYASFRFLREARRPIKPTPVAKRGKAPGKGTSAVIVPSKTSDAPRGPPPLDPTAKKAKKVQAGQAAVWIKCGTP